ncbi:hypothetical protein PVNG_06398 [Plasmodium vivax North Korean]|uniref:Uncharacterized protein n=1 Tax=Plasmodium vivax North Korean TaxID=1035514 RepID=A0A0J9TMY8_PLAVI|nr:hypothetical protein PVNG_06398 [Plasmodium vivax North Korean]
MGLKNLLFQKDIGVIYKILKLVRKNFSKRKHYFSIQKFYNGLKMNMKDHYNKNYKKEEYQDYREH